MSRLARLLVLLLAPVLILVTPTNALAVADDLGGGTTGLNWSVDGRSAGGVEFFNFTCASNLQLTYALDQITPRLSLSNGWCRGGPDLSPGWCSVGEYPCTTVEVEVTGDNCTANFAPTMRPDPNDSTSHTYVGWQAQTVTVPGDCDPTRACLTIKNNGTALTGCTSFFIPPLLPPLEDDTCPFFSIDRDQKPKYFTWDDPNGFNRWFYAMENNPVVQWTMEIPEGPGIPQVPVITAPADLEFAWVFTDNRVGGNPGYQYGAPATGSNAGWYVRPADADQETGFDILDHAEVHVSSPGSYGNRGEWSVVGLQVSYRGAIAPAVEGNFDRRLPQDHPRGKLGTTDPGQCLFYWGEKIAETSDDKDEPYGRMDGDGEEPPPDDSDPPVTPEPDEPVVDWSWIGNILRQILKALQGIWGAIENIASAILDGLEAAFIPDPDSWDLDELLDSVNERPPFSIVGDLGDAFGAMGAAYSNSGQCGSLGNFSPSGAASGELTCSKIKDAPGFAGLYTLVGLGMIALTCVGLFNMVTRTVERGQG